MSCCHFQGVFDAGAAQDVEKMEKLFQLSQVILNIKATEASIASEEHEKLAQELERRDGIKW